MAKKPKELTTEEKLRIAVHTLRSIANAISNDQGWWTAQAKDALKRIGVNL